MRSLIALSPRPPFVHSLSRSPFPPPPQVADDENKAKTAEALVGSTEKAAAKAKEDLEKAKKELEALEKEEEENKEPLDFMKKEVLEIRREG
jgi:geranylgeranyl pyrophosphate synthase